MDDLKKRVEQLIDVFIKEEYGNRLSQFSLFALKSLLLQEIDKTNQG